MKETLSGHIRFCQELSKQYLSMLDACGGDPRSVVGRHAINRAGSSMEKGWYPAWDARDRRTNYSYDEK